MQKRDVEEMSRYCPSRYRGAEDRNRRRDKDRETRNKNRSKGLIYIRRK